MKIPEPLMEITKEYNKANTSASPRIGRSDPLSVDIAKRQEGDEVQYLPLSNKAISTRAVASIVKHYAKHADLDSEEIHPPCPATHLCNSGYRWWDECLSGSASRRHASVTTTQRYYSPKEDLDDNPSDYIPEHVEL